MIFFQFKILFLSALLKLQVRIQKSSNFHIKIIHTKKEKKLREVSEKQTNKENVYSL